MGIKMYKGFDKNMMCRGFQYKEGETYCEDKADLCQSGFHACENPLDTFNYYNPGDGSLYYEVELDGVSEEKDDDTKRVGKIIKIGAALDVAGICKAHFEYVKSLTTNKRKGNDNANLSAQDWSSLAARNWSSLAARNRSSLAAQDGSSLAAQDGSSLAAQDGSSLAARNWSSLAAQDGSSLAAQDNSVLSAGKDSVIAAFNSKAKGDIGTLIAIANREYDGTKWIITDFATGVVDGKELMPNVWYKVENGKFVEVVEVNE